MLELLLKPFTFMLWLLAAALSFAIPIALLFGIYALLTLPLRRRERTRLFLDLLELGLADGKTAERAIMEASRSRDAVMGARFHQLAAYLETGLPLKAALDRVPHLLPPQVVAMLQVGMEIGDLPRVLPACRRLLTDATSQLRGALNYVALLAFIILPIVPALNFVIATFVVPKFEQIARDMEVTITPLASFVFGSIHLLTVLQIGTVLLVQCLMIGYLAGPRLRGRLVASGWMPIARLVDTLSWRLPWRRNRIKRDFSTMLSLLLDAGVPEPRALELAADGTANAMFIASARHAAAQLRDGVKLTDAVASLDGSRDLRWRLANAAQGTSFLHALTGWIETLDAKAFQQEQAAAHLVTTGLVILNGVLIGTVVIAMFSLLTSIATEGSLW